jgi:LacI family transcriptional regulator, galactose operon repressor
MPLLPTKHVTLADVARQSGFSPATVSIVLNEAPLSRYVAATTKLQIRTIAKALGYRPNASARSLRSRRSQTIGVLVFDISDPFCTLILRGIERALEGTGFLPIIMDAHNDHQQLQGYLELLMDHRVEGLIIVANWLFEEGSHFFDTVNNRFPTIVVGRDLAHSEIHSVVVDNQAGGYAALEHLYRLGHRDIAFLKGPEKLSDSHLRWHGMQRFAAEHNLPLDPGRIRTMAEELAPFPGFAAGRDLTQDLLSTGVRFTALAAFDDLTALGAIRALAAAGRTVPGDCSVIGFDDAPLAAFCTPALTTIRQPMEDMGATATAWLLKATRAPGAPEPLPNHKFAPALIARDSTRPL